MKEITGRNMFLMTRNDIEKLNRKIAFKQEFIGEVSTEDTLKLITALIESADQKTAEYISVMQSRAKIDYNAFMSMIMPQPKDITRWRWIKTLDKESIIKLINKDCDYISEKLKGYSCNLSFEEFECVTECITISLCCMTDCMARLVRGTKSNYKKKYLNSQADTASNEDWKRVAKTLLKETKTFIKTVRKTLEKDDVQMLANCKTQAYDLQSGFHHLVAVRARTERKGLFKILTENGIFDKDGQRIDS